MRLRALWESARSDVGQAPDVGDLARCTSAPRGSGASVLEESCPRVSLESRGGVGGALEELHGAVTQRIPKQIWMGRTVHTISAVIGVSEMFVSTLSEHYDRLGMLNDVGSLYSSGLGACHTKDISDEVRVACVGRPLVI